MGCADVCISPLAMDSRRENPNPQGFYRPVRTEGGQGEYLHNRAQAPVK